MRSVKYIILAAFLSVTAFLAVFYASCTKDACKTVTCLNGGTCSGGVCTGCPKGVGGTGCEIVYRNLYRNVYKGSSTYDSNKVYQDNIFTFSAGNDTAYTKMEIAWNNFGPVIINFPITLTNNTASGSSFTVTQTIVGTTIYTGAGTVNAASASLTLTETQTTPDTVVRIITFPNLVRQ